MKKRTLLIAFLFGMVLPLFVLRVMALALPFLASNMGTWTNDMLHKKAALAATAAHRQGPRLFILSGSNAHFGLSAGQLGAHCNLPATNLGLHAGLGLEYILRYGERVIPDNALVLLPLEYQLYGKTTQGRDGRIQILCHDREYFNKTGFIAKTELLTAMHWKDWARLLLAKAIPPAPPRPGEHIVENINESGDETGNIYNMTELIMKGSRRCRTEKLSLDKRKLARLLLFIERMEKRNCKVIMTVPFICEEALDFDLNQPFLDDLAATLARHGIPLVGTPRAHLFTVEDGFDTEYHQNTQGVAKSTARLAQELKSGGYLSHLPAPASSPSLSPSLSPPSLPTTISRAP
ncbi:MAG: hypothetical protein LBK99_21545 [Opitutaceae bacterium]|jgi:hypothetical protein|nr:hypothetical protein [Opitutaceae bacterium]